jgi:hypothetical protein
MSASVSVHWRRHVLDRIGAEAEGPGRFIRRRQGIHYRHQSPLWLRSSAPLRRLASLQATQRTARQEEITSEIIELAAGETASHSAPR